MAARPGLSPCGDIVRSQDPDRYLCALFADPVRREALFALYAFNQEVAKTRQVVSEPMLGHIRLQWWRESIDGIIAGTPRAHEVVTALAAVLQAHGLARDGFDALLDARAADLEDIPPPNMAALIDYARATAGTLSRLALEILGVDDTETRAAADDVAIAWALTGLLRSTPHLARAKRMMFPVDLIEANGVRLGDYHELRDRPELRATVRAVAAVAREHLAAARRRSGVAARAAAPVLLPGRIADLYLKRLDQAGWNPFDPLINREMPLKPWSLWFSAWLRRF